MESTNAERLALAAIKCAAEARETHDDERVRHSLGYLAVLLADAAMEEVRMHYPVDA